MAKLKYDESFPERAEEYAAKGLNNIEIAAQLDISGDTFYTYQRQFPVFAEAVEAGRLAIEDKAAGCLMDLAMGNCFVTTVRLDASGRETKTVRRLAPDLKAVIRWLERNKQYADDGEETAEFQSSESVIPANLKYAADFPEKAGTHAGNGDTDSQIARRLGISPASFYNYKKQFPEFAAALDRGRRECYGRLRGQLLAIALGKCSVTTDTCRNGDFHKITERQLPPSLKAIKYWLAGADGCPSGNAGRMGTASAQGHSKVSEYQSDKSSQSDRHSAQGHSKGSESCADGCPPVASGFCSRMDKTGGCPAGYAGRTGNAASAQGLSKVSESDGCPPVASGFCSRMDNAASAQELSKVSEWLLKTKKGFLCAFAPLCEKWL